MRTRAGVYLVLHWLFADRILGTYTMPRNPKNTFRLDFLDNSWVVTNGIGANLARSLYGLGDTIAQFIGLTTS